MALLRTKSRLTIPAPPPSPIPTGSGSRSAANETFNQFLENSIQLPQLSLPESRFVSGAPPSPAVIDFRSLASFGGGGEAAARMLWSLNEFGAFRIVNHGISNEEISSVVNEAKSVLGVCNKEVDDRSWVEEPCTRQAIMQVRRRSDREASENTAVVQGETDWQIRYKFDGFERFRYVRKWTELGWAGHRCKWPKEKMEKIGIKLEGIGKKLCEILWECIGDQKLGDHQKETIFSIYRYNNNNYQNNNNDNNEKEERESDGMMRLHIPGEHCQFYVNSHQQPSLHCFDPAADTIVVTIGKQLQEWSLGKLKSARSEMIFVPSQTSFSIELKISDPNLLINHHSHSKDSIISISDQILIAFLLLSLYLLYTYISSFFKFK